jgi:hypothetical protein
MEILIAIELIVGVIFVAEFGCKNLNRELSRCSRQRLLDPYDDEWNAGAERDVNRRLSAMRNRVHG